MSILIIALCISAAYSFESGKKKMTSLKHKMVHMSARNHKQPPPAPPLALILANINKPSAQVPELVPLDSLVGADEFDAFVSEPGIRAVVVGSGGNAFKKLSSEINSKLKDDDTFEIRQYRTRFGDAVQSKYTIGLYETLVFKNGELAFRSSSSKSDDVLSRIRAL